jgi:hypothetical protein
VIGEILKVAGIVTFADVAGKKIAEGSVEKISKAIFEDIRGELLANIMGLEDEDVQEVLKERHRKSMVAHTENRFVTLLTKIPKDQRKEILTAMGHMEEEEFEQMLYLLEHDPIPQAFARLRQATSKAVRREWPRVRDWLRDEADPKVAEQIFWGTTSLEGWRQRQGWIRRRRPR